MDFLNIHTHHELPEGETTVLSVGLHPWHLTEDWMEKMPEIEQMLMKGDSFVGECGLDRVCDTPYERQLAAFAAQITLSERLQRPLILHCVRALDDVLRLKRAASQTWVFHGFRGKPQQLRQLLEAHMTNGMPMDDTYYLHLLNIQIDVCEQTGDVPRLMPRKVDTTIFTGANKLKAIINNTLGIRQLCKIIHFVHHIKKPNRW